MSTQTTRPETTRPETTRSDYKQFPIADIETSTFVGPAPTKDLVASVRKDGILAPIHVRENGDGTFSLIAGRRRIQAAITAGMDHIPAIVFDASADLEILAIQENDLRTPNPIRDYLMIKRLEDRGMDEKMISQATGMTVHRVRERMKLKNLVSGLMSLMMIGKISVQTGVEAAALPRKEQAECLVKHGATGKLRVDDIRAVKRRLARTAVAGLPTDMFQDVPKMDRDTDWKGQASNLVRQLIILAESASDDPEAVDFSNKVNHLQFIMDRINKAEGCTGSTTVAPTGAERHRISHPRITPIRTLVLSAGS